MIYVLSDIHGNLRRFESIMNQINFQPDDTLYILGDIVDRNPDGIKILRKIKLGKLADIYEEHKEGMRYLVFGVLTTLVNIVVSAIMYYVIFAKLPEEVKVNLSTVIAIIAAWIFAYVTNKYIH